MGKAVAGLQASLWVGFAWNRSMEGRQLRLAEVLQIDELKRLPGLGDGN